MNWGDVGQALGVWVAGSFALAGLWIGACLVVRRRRRVEYWMRRALVAEANTTHKLCQVIEDSHRKVIAEQHKFIAKQEDLLDTYRAGKDVGDEAEEYLRDGGST